MQIFACVTKTSGIRLCIKHKKNLIEEHTLEYPQDKSQEYLQGTIEHGINDRIISLKEYAESLGLNIMVIIFCSAELKKLFLDVKFEACDNTVIITPESLPFSRKDKKTNFVDSSIACLFNKTKSHIAYNYQLKSIARLKRFNAIIFKPFILLIIALITNIALTKIHTINIKRETNKLNERYYQISEEHRKIKENHPQIAHIGKLAELYSMETLLGARPLMPFDMVNEIFSINARDMEVRKLAWSLPQSFSDINVAKSGVLIELHIEYKADFKGYDLLVDNNLYSSQINNYVNHLKTIFENFKIDFNIDEKNIVIYSNHYIVPAHIRITNISKEGLYTAHTLRIAF
jgi:hypothetical protein